MVNSMPQQVSFLNRAVSRHGERLAGGGPGDGNECALVAGMEAAKPCSDAAELVCGANDLVSFSSLHGKGPASQEESGMLLGLF